MDDFTAGPAPGASDDATGSWGSGTPPPVLLAAMGVAVLIAVTLVAFLVGGGGGDGGVRPLPAGGAGVGEPAADGAVPTGVKRMLLTLSIEGGGSGKVVIEPSGASCNESCSHEFTTGTRVTVSANAVDGSRFEGWNDACTGLDRCSFFMDRERSLTATFEGTPAASQCEDGRDNDGDGLVDQRDPGCDADNTESPDNSPKPVGDCSDGRDNDGDGLVDTAQDPDCGDGTEAGPGTPPPVTTTTAPPPPPPPPPPPTTSTTPSPGATPAVSECRDGRDNDGDGLVDRPADPGCDADGTEAGG